MNVETLFATIRNTLQDHDKNYWDDSELLAYYNDCVRVMAAERKENNTTATLTLDPVQYEYDTSGILRYVRCIDDEGTTRELYPDDLSGKDDNAGVVIKNYNKVYVNDPSLGSVLTFTVVAFPDEENLTSTVRAGDESALRYYVLSKAYEKDSDMENFQKATYFYQMYQQAFNVLKEASSSNYKARTVETTTTYFY